MRLLAPQRHWRSLWPPPLFVHLAELEERYHPNRNRSPARGGASAEAEAEAESRAAALQAAHSREYVTPTPTTPPPRAAPALTHLTRVRRRHIGTPHRLHLQILLRLDYLRLLGAEALPDVAELVEEDEAAGATGAHVPWAEVDPAGPDAVRFVLLQLARCLQRALFRLDEYGGLDGFIDTVLLDGYPRGPEPGEVHARAVSHAEGSLTGRGREALLPCRVPTFPELVPLLVDIADYFNLTPPRLKAYMHIPAIAPRAEPPRPQSILPTDPAATTSAPPGVPTVVVGRSLSRSNSLRQDGTDDAASAASSQSEMISTVVGCRGCGVEGAT